MDLKYALEKLSVQALHAKRHTDYYRGRQPLVYTMERLREVFGRLAQPFIQNWCAMVVNSVLERLQFKGWDSGSETANTALDAFYMMERLRLVSQDIHTDAVVTGDGYLMFDMLDGAMRAFHNSPEQVAVFYSDSVPDRMEFAIKVWRDERMSETHANLYYPERIEKYTAKGDGGTAGSFQLVEDVKNPFGRIPVVHFKLQPELVDVIPLQDAINKVLADMMVAGEFAAFPQRYLLSNADVEGARISAQTILQIPKGTRDEEPTQIGQFSTVNLGMYLDAIKQLAESIATISRTPKHYFLQTGANISGEALSVMESSLVRKVSYYAEALNDGWLDAASFLTDETDVMVAWDRFDTQQPEATARSMQAMVAIGIPLETVLRRFGWGEQEILQMEADMEKETARKADFATEALRLAQLRLERDNTP